MAHGPGPWEPGSRDPWGPRDSELGPGGLGLRAKLRWRLWGPFTVLVLFLFWGSGLEA